MASSKSIHTAVLDTGAIIKNEPSVSTLLSKAEVLVTVPAIISEIRDAVTRSRVETTLKPFLTIRSPSPQSIQFVREFARKTGDLSVLSQPDIQIIALTYELECERNGGDWRLRRTPGQKSLNGSATPKETKQTETEADDVQTVDAGGEVAEDAEATQSSESQAGSTASNQESQPTPPVEIPVDSESTAQEPDSLASDLESLDIVGDESAQDQQPDPKVDSAQNSAESHSDASDSDSEGWITPSNLKKKQAEDAGEAVTSSGAEHGKTMQVAVLTSDFAMQNVILQMNLNLISPAMSRIKHLRTYVLRCHACFQVCKDTRRQFCPRCGGPTLTRVTCSTNAKGEFRLHLKKNMQWNHRGERYSIPKPVHGSANGRIRGGGKGGWGHELILAEDQKEYQEATRVERRQREKNLMDDDYLPGILTGDRGKTGGRIRVGAGRNVNSRKR